MYKLEFIEDNVEESNMGNSIKYDILNREDVPSLLRLYNQLNPTDEELSLDAAQGIWDSIESANIRYYGAKDNGDVVSSCYIYIIPNLTRNGKQIGFIENVITAEDFRGQGLATEVLRLAINYAKSQNCYKVLLQSGAKRKKAHHLYERLGFDGDKKRAFELRF